ncbi:MAG: hypothetical protein Q4B51_03245 [Coriobacteriaceae bacterium]|nr:hypothetical protein [Coriobacteriaceae bacterium]
MSKPPSGLFHGTKGDRAYRGDAESVIAARVKGLDLREHPTTQKQLGNKQRKEIRKKIKNRTATRTEWKQIEWDRRIRKRRKDGIDDFWAKEAIRLSNGEKSTRNWSPEQASQILAGKKPKFNGKTMESHHTYSVRKYPHLANLGEIIYPATQTEHRKGWHGGNTRNSLPGRRIRPINEF